MPTSRPASSVPSAPARDISTPSRSSSSSFTSPRSSSASTRWTTSSSSATAAGRGRRATSISAFPSAAPRRRSTSSPASIGRTTTVCTTSSRARRSASRTSRRPSPPPRDPSMTRMSSMASMLTVVRRWRKVPMMRTTAPATTKAKVMTCRTRVEMTTIWALDSRIPIWRSLPRRAKPPRKRSRRKRPIRMMIPTPEGRSAKRPRAASLPRKRRGKRTPTLPSVASPRSCSSAKKCVPRSRRRIPKLRLVRPESFSARRGRTLLTKRRKNSRIWPRPIRDVTRRRWRATSRHQMTTTIHPKTRGLPRKRKARREQKRTPTPRRGLSPRSCSFLRK
mmetsp:Transcript_15662/g.37475  ORF Transcript_15662/g.37475 Transcript_15662/m.37475 type:complete len:335 (-) Transcript_15662:303-1307(-)